MARYEVFVSRKGKSIPVVVIYPCEDKLLALPGGEGLNVPNLPPSGHLVFLMNGAILGGQCWSLWLAGEIFSSRSQTGFLKVEGPGPMPPLEESTSGINGLVLITLLSSAVGSEEPNRSWAWGK